MTSTPLQLPLHFADRLVEAVDRAGTALIVGIDPRFDQLPLTITGSIDPCDRSGVADAFAEFGCAIVDVVAGQVAAIKPQAAFFEMLGPPGMVALARVIDHARNSGMLVILDGKRGDIGSTAEAYAEGWLGPPGKSAWGCDALTVNPYLGDDSLLPFFDRASATGAGVFVLVKTSNPGSGTIQDLSCEGQSVYQRVARLVQQAAARTAGASGYGAVGAVVGATHPQHLAELRSAMPAALLLVPGYGAQGGKASDLRSAFDDQGRGAVVNSSRAIIFAYRDDRYARLPSWQASVERAMRDAITDLAIAAD